MKLRPTKRQLFSLLPDRIVQTRGAAAQRARYLTFDDGPNPAHTPRILDLLAAHGAHASFFVVGQNAEKYPQLVERIVAEGHLLGNHSWSHNHFGRQTLAEQLDELARTDALLSRFDGHVHHRIRPPQGAVSLRLMASLMRRGRSIAYWSYDSLDYRATSGMEVAQRLRRLPPGPGDIVLMHDDGVAAADALTELLPAWLADGQTFHAMPAERA